MKRSKRITLVLMGTAGLISLAACDETPETPDSVFFKSEAECSSSNDPTDCRDAFETARKEHWRTAPSFTSRESCEAQFGAQNCVQTNVQPGTAQAAPASTPATPGATAGMGMSSWFIPALAGYFIGRTTGGLSAMPYYQTANQQGFLGGQPCNQPGSPIGANPVGACPRPASWSSSSSSSATHFRSTSSSSYSNWGSSSSSSKSASSTSSRGGFGATAAARSSSSSS
jgi:uncharacterized protein YgiB involved in biofilm formation